MSSGSHPGRHWWQRLRPWPHAVIAGGLLIALAAASIPAANLTLYTPQSLVGRYLRSIEAGDAAGALSLMNESAVEGNEENKAAISDAVLSSAVSLPTTIDVGEPRRIDRDTSRVPANFYLGQSTRTMEFTLKREGSFGGLWNHWKIDAATLPQVDVEVTGSESVQINTVDVAVGSGTLRLLPPAVYSVGYSSPWLRSEPTVLDVTSFDSSTEVSVVPEPSEDMIAEVQSQLDDYLAKCAGQETLAPSACPFAYGTADEILGDVDWKVGASPEVQLRAEGGSFTMPPTRATAQISGKKRDIVTAKESDFEEDVDYFLGASVTVEEGQLRVTPKASLLGG